MLSPRKQLSPSKQNISPTHRQNRQNAKQQKLCIHSPQLLMAAIHQLQSIIVRQGGKIPNHLSFGFKNNKDRTAGNQLSFDLKKIQYQSSTKQNISFTQQEKAKLEDTIKTLKVQINNYVFEIKKLQQDAAEYKLLSKLDRDKQVKKFKTQISRLQQQIKQDNEKWEAKFAQMKELYQNNNKNCISQLEKSYQQMIGSLKSKHQKEITTLSQGHLHKIQQIQLAHAAKIRQLQLKSTQIIQKKQVQYERQKQQVRVKHVQTVQKLQKKQEQILVGFQSQKKVQNKKRDEQKISFSKLKQKLYNDLYIVRKQKEQLSKTIVELKACIVKLQRQNKQWQLKILQLGQTHKEQICKNNISHIHQIEKIKHAHNFQLQEIYRKHETQLQNFSQVISNIERLNQRKLEILKQSNKDMQKMFMQRPPRKQDTTTINKLNYEIMTKEQELNIAKSELKQAKLERQNNQKNYTRIFSANGPRQKQVQRQVMYSSRSKDRVYKQANTIDLTFLLNACQKPF